MVEAPSVVVEHVFPVPVTDYAAPASAMAILALAPVVEDIVPASAETYAAEDASVHEYSAPVPAVSHVVLAPVVEDLAPAPSVFHAEQTPVDECSAPETNTELAPVDEHLAPAPAVSSPTPVCVCVGDTGFVATATTRARSASFPQRSGSQAGRRMARRGARVRWAVDGVRGCNRLPGAVNKF